MKTWLTGFTVRVALACVVGLMSVLLVGVGGARAQGDVAAGGTAAGDAAKGEAAKSEAAKSDASALIRDADAIYETSRGKLAKAVEMYELLVKAAALEPGSYEAQWKLARAAWWVAEGLHDNHEKEAYGGVGFEAGKKAVALNANGVEGHYWLVAALGEYSRGIGVARALMKGLGGTFEKHVARAKEIDPRYKDGGPARVLCRYYWKLPWPKRDLAKSEAYCRESMELGPNGLRAKYFLAETLWAKNDFDGAQKYVHVCMESDVKSDPDPIDAKRVQGLCRHLDDEMHRKQKKR